MDLSITEMIYELVRKHIELEERHNNLVKKLGDVIVGFEERLLKLEGRDLWDESKTFK